MSTQNNKFSGAGNSCLPTDAFDHFSAREAELLKYNDQLEAKKNEALARASDAMKDVEDLSFKNYQPSFMKNDALVAPIVGESGLDLKNTHVGPKPDPTDLEMDQILHANRQPLPPSVSDLQPSMTLKTKIAHPQASANEIETLQNTIRFQKSRILALQEELDRCIRSLSQRDDENKRVTEENKKVSEISKRTQKDYKISETQCEKHRKQISLFENRIKDFEKELQQSRKQNDELTLLVRKQETELHGKESRVNRLIEDCERYRATVKDLKNTDFDQANAGRKELNRLLAENRKLERQRNELVGSFKKQMKLIDILKKQRTHLEAARVLSFTEDEFVRILDLGDKLGASVAGS